MLKWAVYGKKNQDIQDTKAYVHEHVDTNKQYDSKLRKSLDAQTVKKSKKPSRYQRRSLGSAARKNNLKSVDKENLNFIGNTPNYFKEGFVGAKTDIGLALKDVSNITPTSTTNTKYLWDAREDYERNRYYLGRSREAIPPDLPPTPPTYSRRIREAKKRKLEMASTGNDSINFKRDTTTRSERRNKCVNISDSGNSSELNRTQSEPSLNELSERLNASVTSHRNSIILAKQIKTQQAISTTTSSNDGLVEIEYDKDLVISCVEKPFENSDQNYFEKRSTLPIFGHHIFMKHPLYFNEQNTECSNVKHLKRSRRKSNEFESSFKSPSIDKKDAHSLIRDGCSPVSITPLSMKLADLRFSAMSTHTNSNRIHFNCADSDFFPKLENPFLAPLRDEETSTEMETKYILLKDNTGHETESTVSTTQMGDVTLEKMIEDIIKSTKKVKSRRKVLNDLNNKHPKILPDNLVQHNRSVELFVSGEAEHKRSLIREAKYVNLSRDNSMSPKNSPSKRNMTKHDQNEVFHNRVLESLSNDKSFILDAEFNYNEREVKTPDILKIKTSSKKYLDRSQSMKFCSVKSNLDCVSSESTPDLYSSLKESNLRLKRQKCVRRKKSTVSNESSWRKKNNHQSILTLEIGIPSPCTSEKVKSTCDPLSSSFNCVVGHTFANNASHSSLNYQESSVDKKSKSRELFGLTLENGIPSPITPVTSLKRPNNNLSDERANKTSKLDKEYADSNSFTPIIEYKPSRRCLTYSPQDASICSTEEKRGSVASNRLENTDRLQLTKGTIDLEIVTKNGVIDVHVIRCRDLQRSCGKTDDVNAYAKVVISGLSENQSLTSQRSVFQRTSVLYGRREPEFQRHLKLPLPSVVHDDQALHISVWHRDKKYRRSEFLGCVSFPLKDATESPTVGTYPLQSQVPRALGSHAASADRCPRVDSRLTGVLNMATDNIDGTSTNDEAGKENNNERGVSNGQSSATGTAAMAAALQKEADEHLFLRYLELDPPEDPNAPRKAPRNGRTPFTTTRKLVRGGTGGFGFTVVWTRPPRVERVVAGGAAERAGLRAGDYIVFVANKNVVTLPEEEVRNIVKSAGQALNLETFRRGPQNQNGLGTKPRLSQVAIPESTPPPAPRSPRAPASPAPVARPPTACSSTSQSLDRRKLHLPQVTFSKEIPGLSTDGRKKALLALVAREQNYATCLQFGLVRFVSPLAERADLITPNDHQLLFQNIEEILRLSEDILDQVVQDDGEIQTSTVVAIYLQKTHVFLSLYKKYCLGLKRADCVLVKKSKDPSGAFARFCTSPPIPRRRPDITSLVHKPLEQFREILRLMRAAATSTGAGPYEQLEKKQLQVIVDQLQNAYQDVTAGSGLMGLAGDGKPLLSVADLESRLVFTRCKPFVLSTGGRQWIFGGELSRVEGRAVRPYWALLFTDLLLFATVSRDRVLFVTEEPVALATVSDSQFNVRKKATEFRLTLGRAGGESPLVSCSPRTPGRTRTVVLRAPSIDLKAVWQSLLQRQIYRAHTMTGTPLGSPLDSPDPQLTFSLATLDSQQRQQTRRSSAEASGTGAGGSVGADGSKTRSRGSSLHLQRWMTQLPESEEMDPPEPDMETWSVEELRKRSKELNLLDVSEIINNNLEKNFASAEKKDHEHSPSKSSSGSQITVRTSPVVVDTIPVCRQCHKKCLSKPNSPLVTQREPPVSVKVKAEVSSQNSNSNKSSNSTCSAKCITRKPRNFSHLERKGAIKILRPEDAPKAALKVIDSIEQSQKMLKSTSYELKTDSPILNRNPYSRSATKNLLEAKSGAPIRTPSPSSSSRNNSPLSTSHTTCSSMVFNSSSNDLRMSNSNIANPVQCVIAQEKYLSEVKCVENITLQKTKSPASIRRDQITRQKAENVLNKVLGMNIITKRENIGSCMKTSAVFLDDDSAHEDNNEFKLDRRIRRSPRMGISAVSKMNGDIKKTERTEDMNANKSVDTGSDEDLELGPLMLMGLSAINPAAHLMRVEPFKRGSDRVSIGNPRPGNLSATVKSESPVPNISVVPPTPDYNAIHKTDELLDDSPDSPLPDEPPYVTLKRYGTLSSLERFPSDETDDGNVRLTSHDPDTSKNFNPVSGAAGFMGWTARAGSFVVEKMNIFSYTESVPSTAVTSYKQPSFLERCLGVSDWRPSMGTEDGGVETGEGSGASGEEAWGTPSSGDLSDNLPDSEHGTLSSPTKSSSSYAGDDDTELMMDELLMAPTITGPTTLRPLLPRRRLEPLLEEECSDSGSEENKPTPTNPESQDSARGLAADGCCAAPRPPRSASDSGSDRADVGGEQQVWGSVGSGARAGGAGSALSASPDRTPTNETPLLPLLSVSRECAEARAAGGAGAAAAGGRRGSASSASTPSTLERTAIHCPPTPHTVSHQGSADSAPDLVPESNPSTQADSERVGRSEQASTPPEERLSPRTEMRLALDRGKDMLADQDGPWAGGSDHWSWRTACQRSLLRRVASADAVTLCRPQIQPQPHNARRTAPHITSHNSVYAWKVPESDKVMEMEQLARVEAQTMRSRTRSLCQNGKIMGFLRRRASSDSPRRTPPSFETSRPFSPRRATVSNQGYYKICFVNGYV